MFVDRARLRQVLNAQSIALVGASERSRWASMFTANLDVYEFKGQVHMVNPRGGSVFGRPVAPSCESIGVPIDVAMLCVPHDAVPDAMRDAARAGAAGVVVLASGYGEAHAAGRSEQESLRALSIELDLALLGPNALGFCNLAARSPSWMSPAPVPFLPGPVALISQSGGVGGTLGSLAARFGIGLSHIVSTGNEAAIDLVDVADCLVDDEEVQALAIFAEAIAQPKLFLDVARRAAERQKAIVMMKIGRSTLAKQLATTHTGALAGDDEIIDAALASAGVIRVNSLEQLVLTAGLVAHTGVLPAGGLGVVSVSGGVNDIVADRAEATGVPLPALSTATSERLRGLGLQFAAVQNPFDVTGAGGRAADAWSGSIAAMLDEPNLSMVVATGFEGIAHPEDDDRGGVDVDRFSWIAAPFVKADAQRRGAVLINAVQPMTPEQKRTCDALGLPRVMVGIDYGLAAIADAMSWSAWIRRRSQDGSSTPDSSALALDGARGTWSEVRSLDLVAAHGVPVVPHRVARNVSEAVAAARGFGEPVVLKVASEHIAHKTDIGGVALDLRGDEEVAAAFAMVTASAGASGMAIDGAVVAPMRPAGVDLLLGVVSGGDWGQVVLLAMGGVEVELRQATARRLLPVNAADVHDMLDEIGAGRLLDGYRGAPAADRDELAAVVVRFTQLARLLGPRLRSIEINPLRVRGQRIEALDALVEWQEHSESSAATDRSAR